MTAKFAAFIQKHKIRSLSKWEKVLPYPRNLLRLINKLFSRTPKESSENLDKLEEYQELVKKKPWNPNARLKLAEIYKRQGETQKSIAEYLIVAEIFSQNGFYPHAVSIYRQIQKQDHSLDMVSLKIAEVYQKMDLLDDAFSQYSHLLRYYHDLGREDKTKEIMALMADFEQKDFQPDEKAYLKYRLIKEFSEKGEKEKGDARFSAVERDWFFDLSTELETSSPLELEHGKEISSGKSYGFEDILKELKKSALPDQVYPNLNYHLGLACSEMGLPDEAIDQFQIAIERGQNPLESARKLGTCFAGKGLKGLHSKLPETSQ